MSSLLDNLPDIDFAQKDTAVIEAEVIERFEKEVDRTLRASDPLRYLLLTFVKYLSMQRNQIDFAGKQNLLKYAHEGFLQNLGALLGVEINEPAAAKTELEFRISTALPSATIIQRGTRATPGNDLYFATTIDAEIRAGDVSIVIPAQCTEAGVIGNGYLAGQVNRLVDTFPFHESVRNIDVTQGGADRESLDSLRERIRLRPESFSTAGPAGAYEYWAKTASQLIVDVAVNTPNPGEVEIIPLLKGGEMPTQAILSDVYKICNDEKRRPLTDKVIVRAPEKVEYIIDFTYFISRRNSSVGASIQQGVTQAIDEFILWQKSMLGRDINPSQLTKMLMKTGIKRVEIREPHHKVLRYFELGVNGEMKFAYGGLEDD